MAAKRLLGGYGVLIAAIAGGMAYSQCDSGSHLQKGPAMIAPIPWQVLATQVKVPALPTTGLWTRAYDFVPAGALVKIDASGKWSYSAGMTTGPDGDMGAILTAAQAMIPSAPVGALLAKVGGSTALVGDGTLFTVGTSTVIRLKADVEGPLYLTINDHVTGMADNTDSLQVQVSIYVPPPPAKPEPADGKDDAGKTSGSK